MAVLENIVTSEQDTLSSLLKVFDPLTIQHSDEICKERLTDAEMRRQWFWTADAPLYQVENDDVFLYLGRGKDNLVFRNIDAASKQILESGNYIPSVEDAQEVMKSSTTLMVKLSDLELKKQDDEFSYFDVSTTKYDKLNPSQKAFAERIYGSGDDFIRYMTALQEDGKASTRVWVLNPNYVKKKVGQDKVLCRASALLDFSYYSLFGAYFRYFDYNCGRVRGGTS